MRDVTRNVVGKRPRKSAKKVPNRRLIIAACLVIGSISFIQIVHPKHPQSAKNNTAFSATLTKPPKTSSKSTKTHQTTDTQQLTLSVWQGSADIVPPTPGKVPVFYRIPTQKPVVFLTIDDGITQSRQILDWLTMRHLPFSLFLDNAAVRNNYAYFRHLQTFGMLIEDHTLTHPRLPKLTLQQQKDEICGAADTYNNVFGRRPFLFRPPYGLMNDDTRQAAVACGMHAIVLWHATVDKGVMHYQGTNHLESGDIVLMHFKPDFLTDIQAFLTQVAKDHLQIARLEDWLK